MSAKFPRGGGYDHLADSLKVDVTGFLLVYAVQVRLMKGHGTGVTTEKSMRTDLLLFFLFVVLFYFFRLDPLFFLLSLPFSSCFLLLFSVHFYRTAIWVALVWSRRGLHCQDNVVK